MGPIFLCTLRGLPGGRAGGTHFRPLLREIFGQGDGDREEWQHWGEMGWLVLCRGHAQDQGRGNQGWGCYQQGQPMPWTQRPGVEVQGRHLLQR